ncbi:phosphoglycerate mutase family protein [Pyrenophora tritici-repentis]|nr:phosphoglycerate mutase family protein [Pyrenophora tritici-repentis]KAF7448964.1 phosphoglycerate mutase family protein [Pyrenophora tritici-repentis]KAI0573128.1 phosphoglycerate mutase family protein [Pyrenophora tritici-repentis]KAI0576498.1 phosphoglycerate mutase family protein [Pyrenophora tritici-repentis]KAI0607009.1 phosphoglycerate mutase family protein [Pyrenophora tritici-repentis]
MGANTDQIHQKNELHASSILPLHRSFLDEAAHGVLPPAVGSMARSMKLFLIRHGETVDNVAQLYAGSRDSALTNHGIQQAIRLGLHLKTLGLTFTHLFSSHLQRAVNTAGKTREAQITPESDGNAAKTVPSVVQLPVLMEQDFGSMEGKKFHDRPPLELSSKEKKKDSTAFVPVESKDSMAHRADSFLDEHLLPLLSDTSKDMTPEVAIVSHGIFLSTLWKRLLLRLPPKSVVLSSELQATARPSLEHLGGWSNTGYLELHLQRDEAREPSLAPLVIPLPEPSSSPAEMPTANEGLGEVGVPEAATGRVPPVASHADPSTSPVPVSSLATTSRIAQGWSAKILTINGKDHLQGLKRTGGGVGSARHDASQKSIDTFFKRRRVD